MGILDSFILRTTFLIDNEYARIALSKKLDGVQGVLLFIKFKVAFFDFNQFVWFFISFLANNKKIEKSGASKTCQEYFCILRIFTNLL